MPKQQLYSIGVFDSGFGGLTILKDIVKLLPKYDYIYLGDTARTPYGNRSQEIIFKFAKQAIDFLFKKGCWLIILACNTASSEALRKIQQEYLPNRYSQRRVLGVIIPAVEEAVQKAKNCVGVMATEGSVKSGAFLREIRKLNPRLNVYQQACPLLVPIVESGEQNSKAAELILQNYLHPLIKNGADTIILGCTHYGVLEGKIKKNVGKKIKTIHEGRIVARKLKDYLKRHQEIERLLAKNSKRKFYTTDLTDSFEDLGSKFFGEKIKPEKINLD